MKFSFLARDSQIGWTMAKSTFLSSLLLVVCAATGCSRSLVVARPEEQKLDDAYRQVFTEESAHNVQDGDIVLRRGYAVLSDIITIVSPGPNVSHAGIYDATTGTVIEAVDGGVTERALTDFVGGSHRVIIVRPHLTVAQRRAAVVQARATIGTPFDYSGFVGINDPERFYCSELVAWAYHAPERGLEAGNLIAPGELVAFGDVVYDSGERGERPLVAMQPYWK
jgi:uncharacterized protein YycO